jgi:hypothetical protein
MKDIKFIKKNENNTVIFNLSRKLAKSFDSNGTVLESSKNLFLEHIPEIKLLVKKRIDELKNEVQNNKVSITRLSKSKNKYLLQKAKWNFKNNTYELSFLVNWFKNN